MKQNLTIEQSAELIKRGASPERATRVPLCATSPDEPRWSEPIFTLTDILSLLPRHIRTERHHYYLRLNTFVLTDEANPLWIARYSTNTAITLHERFSEELIDTLYSLLISLLDDHVKLD